jgi:signal transduction histidine kinase
MAALDYTRPEANKLQYRLSGWDHNWVITFDKSARYSNLPPGNYTLRVRASNSGDTWGNEERIFIMIQAPFWKTNWFYASVTILVLGVVIAATRSVAQRRLNRKLRELEKQQAVMHERERISKDIHDDLGSGLSKISILSELAKHSKTGDDFTLRQLSKISDASHELIDNLGELIWSHNPANDSLKKLLWYIREHLGPVFDGTEMHFTITIPELSPDKDIPAEWRRNVFLITKEALHNVLKHSKATEVTLSFTVVTDRLQLTVTDNGCGFDVNQKSRSGNGLTNIRKRVEACRGLLHIDSKPGMGTRVHVEVPIT